MSLSAVGDSCTDGVAIIGMAGRFPGAGSVRELWRNQLAGIESVSYFKPEELEWPPAGTDKGNFLSVAARSVLEDIDQFDPAFFGMLPREAQLTDPQQRLFLECCWEALEDGGYDPFSYAGLIGVYAGTSPSSYFLSHVCQKPGFAAQFTGGYQVDNYTEMLGNMPDYLATRVSYKLNLRGPAFTLVSACSTSLVAVAQACQALLTYQSDMMLAGASSITLPQRRATIYREGGMTSPDGHCRTFDADANGTVFGSGVGVILLKRVEDALRDGDQIYAVIRGFAVNNDGSARVGFTAPSVEGQAAVIASAVASAGIDPSTIGYVEAHGTATPLGDPIELAALDKVFRHHMSERARCALGSVKTNVGHLDVASGVTGLIHAAHVVRHGVFPPTLHFKKPNSKFDFANSPFYVNAEATSWPERGFPRRAGVSSFGVGGTNAHLVLEQPPESNESPSVKPAQLIVLSARSESALEKASDNLAKFLQDNPRTELSDAAWTLQVGRRAFDCRRVFAVTSAAEAVQVISSRDRRRMQNRNQRGAGSRVAFMFPGQGSQHPNMAREMWESEPAFRHNLQQCAEILKPHLDADLLSLLYPPESATDELKRRVTDTIIAQPAIFSIEYSLAQLWLSWGIHPESMVGHSVGEFVAACLAGVMTLEEALVLVANRGRMMQSLPAGGMLSVRLREDEARSLLTPSLSLAAVNGPSLCVVSGPLDELDSLEKSLESKAISSRRLVTSHAFHSSMMDPIIEPFTEAVARVRLRKPAIPYCSCVTGTWITEQQATDPGYWANHFRQPVLFSAAVRELLKEPDRMLLEVGPGNVLGTLARQHAEVAQGQNIISSLSDGYSGTGDAIQVCSALGALWLGGIEPNWSSVHAPGKRRRISLPTYPFDRKRYWLDVPGRDSSASETVLQQPPAAEPQSQQTSEEKRELAMPTSQTVTATKDRAAHLSTLLAVIFEELSGVDLSEFDSSTTFLEMGFDSLFLTQVTQAIQGKFGIKVTFRQLMGDESSLSALSAYLDKELPSGEFAPAAPEVVQAVPLAAALPPASTAADSATPQVPVTLSSPASLATGGGDWSPERLMREQLQVMSDLCVRQLDALRGVAPVSLIGHRVQAAETSPQQAPTPAPTPVPAAATQTVAPEKEEFKPFGPYKPLQHTPNEAATERQTAAVQSLVDEWTSRTPGSKKLTQLHRARLADPRVVSGFRTLWKEIVYPLHVVKSKGSRLWDVDGNEYIDLLNGFGPIIFGHRPEFVEQAIAEQLSQGFEIGPQTPLAGEIAELFCEMTGNERMTFCNTGSEAVMAALRVARTVTGRQKVVIFTGDYHGMFDEVLVKGFRNKAGAPQTSPIAPGIPRESVSNMVVLDYGTPESLEWIRQNASSLAAVLVEPVQSRHPSLRPVEFLRTIREITQASGTAFIFDEVVTGFRVHPGGCQALFNVRADMATYGKVLAGGMPIGVLGGKSKFLDALDGGYWQFGDNSFPEVGVTFFAGTFVRHPLALSATKAVLTHLKQEGPGLQEALTAKTERLVGELNELFEVHSIRTRVENFGSVFFFRFPVEERFASLLYYHLRLRGVHILEGFPCFLTTAHSEEDLKTVVRAFRESVIEMKKGDLFSSGSDEPAAPETLSDSSSTVHDGVTREAPLTEPQLEILLADQLGPEASCSYNESFTLHLRGDLNEPALRLSLQQIVDRHDALRIQFSSDGESILFAPKLELEIPIVDLTGLSDRQRESRLEEIISADARTPFRLSQGPLVRVQLIKYAARHALLLFTSHHIVCDGWSTNLILDELARLYNAACAGTSANLPKPLSFEVYSRRQKQLRESPEGLRIEKYWVERFRRPVGALDLPIDHPRPAIREFPGATIRKKIGAAAHQDLKKMGARQKCTLFVTLLSGFQILLNRLTGQDDIVVGVPTAGQSLLEDEILVGHCVNFLPLREQIQVEASVAEHLGRMKQTVLEGYDHQNYTYGRLVRQLSIPRDPSRLPLTEVQFNLERVGEGLQFKGLDVEVDPNPKSFVNFDIFLNIVESKDGLTLDCDFSTVLFEPSTIARWLDHYEALLAAMAAQPEIPIKALSLFSQTGLQKYLAEANPQPVDYPRDRCAHQLFEAQVLSTPERIAVDFEGQQLTYLELNSRANQLSRHLTELGVGPGRLVGVFVDRSLDMIVSLLAVMKAGGAYVPMDPTYPPDRIAFVLQDADAPVLLTQEKLVPLLPNVDSTKIVKVDADWRTIERRPKDNLDRLLSSTDLAYVIYTSGSTGMPKGVEIPHQALVNFLCSMMKQPGINADDVLLAVTTLSFDIAGLELFLPITTGARLVIATRETAADGHLILARLKSCGATMLQATPITFRLMIEAGWTNDLSLKILCGGEALTRDLADQILKRAPVLWNMYGPTETTIWSAASIVEEGEGPVLLGPPIDNTQFHVLDPAGQLVPLGVAGELCIGGDGLARGYFRRPELTAERFIPDPFTDRPEARLYRTGDLVRRRPDGFFEFLGRLDFQVKLRGFRIELGEIETALSRYPGVRQAVVSLREDIPGDKRLVAYLASDQAAITVTEIRDFLAGKLPNYMLPAAVLRVDAMPLTLNGKVDRKALPAPETKASAPDRVYVAPRDERERTLAAIWGEVLKRDQIGIEDSVFELGADSLHIFQIATRANRAGIPVNPAQILRFRTISAILAQLGQAGSAFVGTKAAMPITRVARDRYVLKHK